LILVLKGNALGYLVKTRGNRFSRYFLRSLHSIARTTPTAGFLRIELEVGLVGLTHSGTFSSRFGYCKMDLGVYVNKTPNGELTLYRCNTAREKNMRAEGVEVGQWKVFELGKGYDCEVACRHSVRTMPNGDQRLELVTTAAYIRFSLYSGLLKEECQNYLYSPLIGKIAIGCGCGKLEPGTLYDIKAVWIPPNTALFRWLRTVELCHFVVPSGGIRKILVDFFLQGGASLWPDLNWL
uniref:Uncharacterized protein n=1 Tax=Bursaphelenchus xylophilus TaxID=6326 RepID=A0A1I7SID8_BURXY